jgi:hypothetical protein
VLLVSAVEVAVLASAALLDAELTFTVEAVLEFTVLLALSFTCCSSDVLAALLVVATALAVAPDSLTVVSAWATVTEAVTPIDMAAILANIHFRPRLYIL